MRPTTNKRNSVPKGQSSTQTLCDFPDLRKVETLTQQLFLTVDSEPGAEHEWQRFSCNDVVRATSPDFLRSLKQMFADKPPGQYLIRVDVTIDLATLDFEPQAASEEPDLETEAAAAYYASYATQDACLSTGTQTEAQETSKVPWQLD